MGTHTPGPWAVGFSDGTGPTYITAGDHAALKRPEESLVVVVAGCEDSWGIPQGVRNPADARLIAAAPELLAALRATQDALLAYDGHATDPTNAAGWSDSEAFAAYMQASAAIALATGGHR